MTLHAVEACPACGGTGWLVQGQGQDSPATVVHCPQCRSAGRVRRLLAAAEIPPRYWDRGFDAYATHHPSQEKALKRAVQYVEDFSKAGRGLLFTGPCGVGKTHLSVAVLKTVIQEKSVAGRFVDETELLRRLHYSYEPQSPETERGVLHPLMDADLVVWDDLGTGRPTDWARETMRTVINYRYTHEKQTIFTTNRPLRRRLHRADDLAGSEKAREEGPLEESIGRRLFSRIMEMCEVVEVDGPDARTETLRAAGDSRRLKKNASGAASSLTLPVGMLRCPKCDAPRIDQLDSKEKQSADGPVVEISCQCRSCGDLFLARYQRRTARLEYPSV